MNCSGYCDQRASLAKANWQTTQRYCGFVKPPECKLPHVNLDQVYKKSIKTRSVDLLLLEVCEKLKMVQMERYIMLQQAKIEGYNKGMEWWKLDHLDWFDYSGCPKRY